MMENQELRLEEKEVEMVNLLRKLNMTRPVALTLVCLAKGQEVTSREIEMASRLRQPEVSIAMRYLDTNDWVEVREEKKNEGKGRPIKLYKLIVSVDSIIRNIEEEILSENKLILENIERLKNLS